MVAVTSMPMGQPMGQPQMSATSPMPNPMGGSAPNPMMPTNPMPNPMMGAPMGGPPPQMGGQPPVSPAPNPNSSQVTTPYGGSRQGRANFKNALGRRKNIFLQSQLRGGKLILHKGQADYKIRKICLFISFYQ